MNDYTYEEISLGQKETFTVTVTEKMMEDFCAVTGDVNPLHNDAAYAATLGHPGRVVYGMLTASFLSTLAGVYLPGKRSLIQEVKVKFAKPVYVGDTISVEGIVEEKHDIYSLIVLKVTMKDQDGRKVCRATMRVGVEG